MKEWAGDRLRPAYLLLGNPADISEALSSLRARFGASPMDFTEYGDESLGPSAALCDARTPAMLAERRVLLVSNPKLVAAGKAEFVEYLKDPVESTTLVLVSDEKRAAPADPVVKAAGACGAVCVFGPLKEAEALKSLADAALKEGKRLDAEAARTLVAEAGTDWSVLRQELEKALLYCGKDKTVTRSHVLGCLGYRKGTDPYALPRLVERRLLPESLVQLRRWLADGKADEQNFRALYQISGAVRRQLKARQLLSRGASREEIFRDLRLHAWYDRDYLETLEAFSEKRLYADLRLCLTVEADLKSKVWLEPRIELERLLAALCRRRAAPRGTPIGRPSAAAGSS